MNQASILSIVLTVLTIAALGYCIQQQRIKYEIDKWDRGLSRDVCLPSTVACGTLEQGRQASQCDLIQDSIKQINESTIRQLKGNFPNLKPPPAAIFNFTTKPFKDSIKPILVHAATVPQLSDGGLCNQDKPITGKLGSLTRQPLFYGPTKAFHIFVCFNKYRAVQRGLSDPFMDDPLIVKRMKSYGVMVTIAHQLHHAWMGQSIKTGYGHPSVSCQLMCDIPIGPDLSITTLTLMKKVIEDCRVRPPDI